MSLHPVATIRDVTRTDVEKSIITMVWLARQVIGSAASLDGEPKLDAIRRGREFARSATSLSSYNHVFNPVQGHMEACEQALTCAEGHWQTARLLMRLTGVTGVPEHDRLAEIEQIKRTDRSVSDALKLAKSECHRALARAVEMYPGAYEKDES